MPDAVLGGIDGGVTIFAIIAGAVGGKFSGAVIVVLGFANLLADGFSMIVTAFALFGVGVAKGVALARPVLKSGFETLLVGGLAAALAYGMGHGIRGLYESL